MSEDEVDIEFDPPRSVREYGRSYWLSADGELELQLPAKKVTLTLAETPDGERVVSAKMARWIAEDRGLLARKRADGETAMSMQDWYTLGLAMALVVRGVEVKDINWEVGKFLEKLGVR